MLSARGFSLTALSAGSLFAAACSAATEAPAAANDDETAKGVAAQGALQEPGWQLVFADEFTGSELDRAKWTPEISCWGGGNDERQCYTDRPENIEVRDGALHLIAKKESFEGPTFPPEFGRDGTTRQSYTSGKVRTRGLADWRYGRIEIRAKPPAGQGTWPAVWMMPAEDYYGAWPLSGEIDILEAVNLGAACPDCDGEIGENRTISALHFGDPAPGNDFVDVRVALPDGALPSDDFHVWAAEWAEGEIRFFLDGVQYFRVTNDKWHTASPRAAGNPDAPFDRPFYIMANLAIGGRLAEQNNEKGVSDTATPNAFMIDWIRIYQCKEDKEKGRACLR